MLSLIAAAHALPLVHDGGAEAAVARVAEVSGLEPATFEPFALPSLQSAAPVLVAGGAVEVCLEGSDVAALLQKAEGALLYGRFEEASVRIDDAKQAALCADQPPPASLLARIELFGGLIGEERGAPEAARARYAAALGYDRDVAWPSSYPPERRGLFDEVRAAFAVSTTTLKVRPSLSATLDGRAIGAEVPTGEHFVRVGSVSVRITLDDAPNRLVVPAAYPDDALALLDSELGRADLTALFAVALGEGVEVWVARGDEVWRGIAGRTDWELVADARGAVDTAPLPAPEPVEPEPSGKRVRWGVPITGLVVAAAGASVALVGYSEANAARNAVVETDYGSGYDDQEARYQRAGAYYAIGWSVVGVGLAVAGVGAVPR